MSRSQMKYHPRIGFTYMPNAKFRVPSTTGGYLVGTNATGFRSDSEFLAERDPDMVRALLFGDSQTAGDGAANARRYSDLVEQLVPGLQVYNYGLSGSGPDQQFLAYQEYANVEHDLVVVGLYVENIRRVTRSIVKSMDANGIESYFAKPYFEYDDGRLVLRHVPVPKKGWALDALPAKYQSQTYNYSETNFYSRDDKDKPARLEVLAKSNALAPVRKAVKNLAMRVSGFEPLPEYDDADDPSWTLLRALLQAWIEESDKPMLIMPIPHYAYLVSASESRGYQIRFTELAADAGCHLYDPLPDLRKLSAAERRELWSDAVGHLSLRGHEVIAELLAPVLAGLKTTLAGKDDSAGSHD